MDQAHRPEATPAGAGPLALILGVLGLVAPAGVALVTSGLQDDLAAAASATAMLAPGILFPLAVGFGVLALMAPRGGSSRPLGAAGLVCGALGYLGIGVAMLILLAFASDDPDANPYVTAGPFLAVTACLLVGLPLLVVGLGLRRRLPAVVGGLLVAIAAAGTAWLVLADFS